MNVFELDLLTKWLVDKNLQMTPREGPSWKACPLWKILEMPGSGTWADEDRERRLRTNGAVALVEPTFYLRGNPSCVT